MQICKALETLPSTQMLYENYYSIIIKYDIKCNIKYIYIARRNSKEQEEGLGRYGISGFDDSNGFIGVYLSSKFIRVCVY